MPVRPVEYHPFQYPRKYRPLGYGAWEPPPPPPPEPVSPGRRRRTVALILLALLATIVIHVGIAAAYDGHGGPVKTVVAKPADTTLDAAACDQQDPFTDPEFVVGDTPDDSTGAATAEVTAGLRARL